MFIKFIFYLLLASTSTLQRESTSVNSRVTRGTYLVVL
nr:MAG TPA: hypothetical protein [Bacteriophage sp.]